MKQAFSYILLTALIIAGCRKEDDTKLPELERVPLPQITKDTAANATISSDDPATFKGRFIVDLYFKNDVPPQKMDIVIRKNDSVVKVFKEAIATFPTTVDITGADLTALFGAAPVLGDNFEIGATVTTQSGSRFDAFPAVGSAYATNIANQPGASPSVAYSVVCPFSINDFVGSATVDDPDFWEASYPVTISLEGPDTYKVAGWFEDPKLYILVKVNAAALTASIAPRVYAASIAGLPYTNWTADGTGVVDACATEMTLTINHSVDQGSFSPAVITIKK